LKPKVNIHFIKTYSFVIEGEISRIEKQTVLDLCANMFEKKDQTMDDDDSEMLEIGDLKTVD
jgi:hypothetical protein